ncbi:MAG: TolC family protein [Bacteroidales bacterium]|nr:TolC family protein [Bacteroidales bacterium]
MHIGRKNFLVPLRALKNEILNGIITATVMVFLFQMLSLELQGQEQKVWSLEECILYAQDHNLDIKKQFWGIEQGEQTLLYSKLNLLPYLNGYGSHGYNWGKRIDPFTNDFATDRVQSNNFYLSADWTLFDGLTKMNAVKRNEINLLATRYDVDAFMDDIAVSVATFYLQILYYMEYAQTVENQVEVSRLQLERTKKLVEAGTLAKGDQLTLEAQLAAEEYALVDAKNNLSLAYLDLVQLLELESPEGFEIEKPELGLIEDPESLPEANQIFLTALEKRPEIKSAQLRVESSGRNLQIAKGGLYPRLSLGGSWGTGYSGANKIGENPVSFIPQIGVTQSGEAVYSISEYTTYESQKVKSFNDQLNDNLNRAVGLSLNIPIFNGWAARNNIAVAKIAIEQSALDLDIQKNRLRKTIQQAHNDAKAALNQHNAAEKKVNATREAFRYSEQKYNVGMINSVEYNDAKKEFNNAESELLQAKYDYIFRTKILDFYMGRPLTLKR